MGKYSTRPINKVKASGEHFIHWTCAVFSHIARKINNVCIFSQDQVTHDITVIDCSLNYSQSAIWADIDILLIVNITAFFVNLTTVDL